MLMPFSILDMYAGITDFVADVDVIASELSAAEREVLRKLSLDTAIEASLCNSVGMPLGVCVAGSPYRNFLMTLLTGNAVKAFYKKNGKHPVLMDLGCGSGINLIAALLIDPDAQVSGIDIDPLALSFANRLIAKNCLSGRIKLVLGDFCDSYLSDKPIDIVVNENLASKLSSEPLIEAANAAAAYTHHGTLHVPAALDVYIVDKSMADLVNTRFYCGRIDLTKTNNLVLKFDVLGLKKPKDFLHIVIDAVDYKGDVVIGNGKKGRFEVPSLNLSGYLPSLGLHADGEMAVLEIPFGTNDFPIVYRVR